LLPGLLVAVAMLATRVLAPGLFALAWAAFVANLPATVADLFEAAGAAKTRGPAAAPSRETAAL
jgi:hypothetical protein